MKVIRWLGAFGVGKSLHAALEWELSQQEREVAAEPIPAGYQSMIPRPRVGLLVKTRAVKKVFRCDVWSVTNTDQKHNGKLRKTRTMSDTIGHSEAFVLPQYAAIVVRNYRGLPIHYQRTITFFSQRYGLPIVSEKEVLKTGSH